MKLLDHCIIFATYKHSGQLDKAGLPYIYHPLRIMLSQLPRPKGHGLNGDVRRKS